MTSFEQNIHPSHIFGSSIITIVIGALAFITAFAWNAYVQQVFKTYTTKKDELDARLSYAFLVTAMAVVIGFLVMYYVEGCKW